MREVLLHAVEQPSEARAAFLDAACAGDAQLRSEVESLLANLQNADGFLASPTRRQLADLPLSTDTSPATLPLSERPGTQVGRYKLLQLIGEGGFGSVFMAEQEHPVRRRVALKIIKLGMDTKQVIARFEAERQALAMMDHPNIAKVLDGGTTESGRPYFVMELVKGVPITEYCDTQNLTTRERLALFVELCQAVQHAHQKGIIHRDIKPSNVLVSMADGKPVPKVIDFGIAKATNARLTERTYFTEFRQFIGTPEYMSPEQAEMTGIDIDTRSDIYSLGVLLYELLTGSTPFDPKQLRRLAYEQIQKMIREAEPPKPSTRLMSMGETLAAVAQKRKTDPRKLTQTVQGELDWISMKCLEKDRTRRYETANGLAMDVQRYLEGEPVVAAPPSRMYRVRKFVRRNKGPVAAVGMVVLALVLGIIGTSIGLARAEIRRKEAVTAKENETAEKKRAQKERDKAGATVEFMRNTLGSMDPDEAVGRDTTLLKQLMDKAAERIDKGELKDNPEAEVRLRETISSIYANIGEFDQAVRMATRALDLARQTWPGDNEIVADCLLDMAELRSTAQARLIEALALREEALAMRLRIIKGDSSRVAWDMSEVAISLNELGRTEEALEKYRAALEMRQRLFKRDHPDVASGLRNVADCLFVLDRPQEALPMARDALAMYQRLYPRDHTTVARSMSTLAICLDKLGRQQAALLLHEDALKMRQRLYQRDHPAIATSLANLAGCLDDLGRHDEALSNYRDALAMIRRIHHGDHPDVACKMQNFACCLGSHGRAAEALPYLEEATAMLHRLFKSDHPLTAAALLNTAECLVALGRVSDALQKYEEALAMKQNLPKRDDLELVKILNNMGMALQQAGRLPEAEKRLQQGLDMSRRLSKDDSAQQALVLHHLADAVRLQGRLDVAETLGREAVQMYKAHPNWPQNEAKHALIILQDTLIGKDIVRLTAQIQKKPDASLLQLLGMRHASLKQFPEALTDFTAAMHLDASNHRLWYYRGCLLAYLGQTEEYRKLCREMRDRFGQSQDGPILDRTGKTGLLLPASEADVQQATTLVDRALSSAPPFPAAVFWFQLGKGLAEYRAGHFDSAIEWASKSHDGLPSFSGIGKAADLLVIAMSFHRLERAQEGRSAFDRAMLYIKQTDTVDPTQGDLEDWLIARILAREARDMFATTRPATQP